MSDNNFSETRAGKTRADRVRLMYNAGVVDATARVPSRRWATAVFLRTPTDRMYTYAYINGYRLGEDANAQNA